MEPQSVNRHVLVQVTVPATVAQVWEAWTTEQGVKTFFAPECNIDLRPDGYYEMFFELEAEPGKRGGEGMKVMALQPPQMLSFTWNAPLEFPTVRGQMTHVVVWLDAVDEHITQVTLKHDGWGAGGEWDAAYDYFVSAWGQVVLPRLKYRFTKGPLDWAHLPDLTQD